MSNPWADAALGARGSRHLADGSHSSSCAAFLERHLAKPQEVSLSQLTLHSSPKAVLSRALTQCSTHVSRTKRHIGRSPAIRRLLRRIRICFATFRGRVATKTFRSGISVGWMNWQRTLHSTASLLRHIHSRFKSTFC